MRNTIVGLCIVGAIMVQQGCSPSRKTSNSIPSYPGYSLAWSDEFNVNGNPDSSNWQYEKGFVRNHELQWYQPENAYCKNGLLVIEARKEQKANPNYEEGSNDWRKN